MEDYELTKIPDPYQKPKLLKNNKMINENEPSVMWPERV